ncbi:39S ribosomal protein L54, mitochondrial isoform X1 [Osmia bicornis bicornis]|uniref:39S ribosomal protein L54, mitochondrial isoform X1 n=1 Tax=Osmia bicornis bicornis TaxID=1437191 RepID=UPI0010F627CA|nr:39S ribosomal protein L54, mitochondrial isoform X1 [Osmia bicornis bicornis]
MNMSLFSVLRLSLTRTNFVISAQYATLPKAVGGAKTKKQMSKTEKIQIPVEKDVNKLLTYVCGLNYYKEGEEIQLKPDDQYPEWLWNIRTEPVTLEDLDPNTKQYWRYLRKEGIRKKNKMIKHRKL